MNNEIYKNGEAVIVYNMGDNKEYAGIIRGVVQYPVVNGYPGFWIVQFVDNRPEYLSSEYNMDFDCFSIIGSCVRRKHE